MFTAEKKERLVIYQSICQCILFLLSCFMTNHCENVLFFGRIVFVVETKRVRNITPDHGLGRPKWRHDHILGLLSPFFHYISQLKSILHVHVFPSSDFTLNM